MTTQYLGGIAGGGSWFILRGILVVALSIGLFQGSNQPVQADAGGPAVQIGQQELMLLKQLSNITAQG
jgi:hypothetical protein